MAFIKCESCGKQTTDKREKCPECGAIFKPETSKRWEKNEAQFKKSGSMNPADKTWIRCPQCEYQGESEKILRGNGWIELVLYLFYIIPGIIYSVWRRTGDGLICPACLWVHVVRIDPIYDGEISDNKNQSP